MQVQRTKTTRDTALSENVPVHPNLISAMKMDLVVNEGGQVWLLHEKPFPGVLRWAEYDADLRSVTLVMADGRIQGLGLRINDVMDECLRNARILQAVQMHGEQVADVYLVTFICREAMV